MQSPPHPEKPQKVKQKCVFPARKCSAATLGALTAKSPIGIRSTVLQKSGMGEIEAVAERPDSGKHTLKWSKVWVPPKWLSGGEPGLPCVGQLIQWEVTMP